MSAISSSTSTTGRSVRVGLFLTGACCIFYGGIYYKLRGGAEPFERHFDDYENRGIEKFKGVLWVIVGLALIVFSSLNLQPYPLDSERV